MEELARMQRVFVRGLRVDAAIGAYDWEKTIRQPLTFELEMLCDNSAAALSDNLEDISVDYAEVVQTVRDLLEHKRYALIEALAEDLATRLLSEFEIAWLRLSIEKPRPDDGFTAALVIEREK